jgi:uncharacterized protein (DUF2236 family)
LILQVAHPVVGAAVSDHSTFRSDPWTRLARTVRSVNRLVFGPAPTASAEGRRLRQVHGRIRGVDGGGNPYHALQPDAYAWVHLTLVHFFVEVQRVLGQPLRAGQRQQLYREWRRVGCLLGVRDDNLPPDWPAFRRYFDDTVARTLENNRAVQDVLAAVAHPSSPFFSLPPVAWRPLADRAGGLALLFTVGTLPPLLRARIGLRWTAQDAAQADRHATRLRALFSVLPPPVLTQPAAWPYLIRARLGPCRHGSCS